MWLSGHRLSTQQIFNEMAQNVKRSKKANSNRW